MTAVLIWAIIGGFAGWFVVAVVCGIGLGRMIHTDDEPDEPDEPDEAAVFMQTVTRAATNPHSMTPNRRSGLDRRIAPRNQPTPTHKETQ